MFIHVTLLTYIVQYTMDTELTAKNLKLYNFFFNQKIKFSHIGVKNSLVNTCKTKSSSRVNSIKVCLGGTIFQFRFSKNCH